MIVAEIGNNHEGSFKQAKKLIQKAAQSGVDAVKFQTFKTEEFINDTDQKKYNRYKKFELTKENFTNFLSLPKARNYFSYQHHLTLTAQFF